MNDSKIDSPPSQAQAKLEVPADRFTLDSLSVSSGGGVPSHLWK